MKVTISKDVKLGKIHAKVIDYRVEWDQENDSLIVCVRFGQEPTNEDLELAAELAPFPWGQALPSCYVKESGWWDVGQA